MLKAAAYQNRIELLQGTLDLLILQTLRWGPQHGYGISHAIRASSGERLDVDTGSLYPGAPPAGARGLDRLGVARLRQQAARQGLPSDARGPAQARRPRRIAVERASRGDGRSPVGREKGSEA